MNLSRLKPLVANIDKLKHEYVTIVGCGALGSVTAELMVRNGVGTIILIDNDVVEDHNLQRQNYVKNDIGQPKVNMLKQRLVSITDVNVITVNERLSAANVHLVSQGLVLDCTDNWYTRKLINRHAQHWVFASAIKDKGMVQYLNKKPCMECWLSTNSEEHCADLGVYNATTHVIASIQSHLALTVLTSTCDNMLYHFTLPGTIHNVETPVKQDCQGCNSTPSLPKETLHRVCTHSYKAYTNHKGSFKKGENYTLHTDGTIMIMANSMHDAQAIYDEILAN